MSSEPQTLVEAIRHFADPDVTLNTMVGLRWPTGVHCPTYGRTDVRFIATRRMWECKEKHPRKQFSAKIGCSRGCACTKNPTRKLHSRLTRFGRWDERNVTQNRKHR